MAEVLSSDGLEVGFDRHIMSDLPQGSGGDVPRFAMAQRQEATKRSRQSVTDIQWLAAHAKAWEPRRCPAAPETQATPEVSLGDGETMAAEGRQVNQLDAPFSEARSRTGRPALGDPSEVRQIWIWLRSAISTGPSS